MIFKRKIYTKMLDWKQRSNGTSALLIKGARRIGKSTVAQEFARNEYKEFLAIDFSTASADMIELFNDVSDLNTFFINLEVLTGKSLPRRESVIIFDEVQLCPRARQAIKTLVADGRYDYIETGSLLTLQKNIKDILVPSEEYHLSMYPLDFEEFTWAIGKSRTFDLLRLRLEQLKPIGEPMHRAIMKDFRNYMIVGGMPQAINAYLTQNSFADVDIAKRQILDLYYTDFRKIDAKGRAKTIYASIPAELSRNTMRYKVGSVIEGGRLDRLDEIFADVADSLTVNMAYHANDPGVGYALHANYNFFKMFLADTGLFVTLAFEDRDFTDNEIYRKLLFDKLPADLGFVYENVVAQLLASSGHKLYYYTFKEQSGAETRTKSYEIDFLITCKDKMCPIEVKSSNSSRHKSLDLFQEKYSSRIGRRYLLGTKDISHTDNLICLPIYMAGLL